ncbi:MAG: hypothetical protein QOI93_5670 [Rhodospirillaceae bacterium]|nr:hypothetical protein [Rhodospirillaceae bacterium]
MSIALNDKPTLASERPSDEALFGDMPQSSPMPAGVFQGHQSRDSSRLTAVSANAS